MATIDIAAIRNRAYLCAARRDRWASEVGVDDQDVIDDLRRAKELAVDDVPALCDEIEQLRAELTVKVGIYSRAVADLTSERVERVTWLRYALVEMVTRYGSSQQKRAYFGERENYEEFERRQRAVRRQFAAVQRLADALTDLARGTR